jgi:hypothetical protein
LHRNSNARHTGDPQNDRDKLPRLLRAGRGKRIRRKDYQQTPTV